jgi:chemotaxis-related protein WspB
MSAAAATLGAQQAVFLLFQIGSERYALPVQRVAEVLPLVALKTIPGAPKGVAGVFDYRGAPVPVIDLSALTVDRAAERRLGTRIVLCRYQGERLLGLIAEKATETLRRNPADFIATGIHHEGAPYLGPVCPDARGMIQLVSVDQLLPESVRSSLFRSAGG